MDTQPADQTAHRYTGAWAEDYDTASNLILMGARPYDPSLGRFLAVDPVDGGSLNNYDYAGQDPINSYDLGGLLREAQDDGCTVRANDGAPCTYNTSTPCNCNNLTVSDIGNAVETAVEAAAPYLVACGTGAAQGAIFGCGGGAALGCLVNVGSTALERHGHGTAGKIIEGVAAFRDLHGAMAGLRDLLKNKKIEIEALEWGTKNGRTWVRYTYIRIH